MKIIMPHQSPIMNIITFLSGSLIAISSNAPDFFTLFFNGMIGGFGAYCIKVALEFFAPKLMDRIRNYYKK